MADSNEEEAREVKEAQEAQDSDPREETGLGYFEFTGETLEKLTPNEKLRLNMAMLSLETIMVQLREVGLRPTSDPQEWDIVLTEEQLSQAVDSVWDNSRDLVHE